MQSQPTSMTLRSTSLRGLETAWLANEHGGEGPLLLFLHGYPDSAHAWDLQFPDFNDDSSIIAPFARGVAPSAKANDVRRYGTSASSLDLLSILRQTSSFDEGGRPLFVIGHDLGCVHAMKLAELLGDRLTGLVLINGLSVRQWLLRLRRGRQFLKSWYVYLFQIPWVPEKLLSLAPQRFFEFAHDSGGLPRDKRETDTDPLSAVSDPINQYRAFARTALRELRRPPRKLKVPTLVLWGDEDQFLVPPTVDEFESVFRNVAIRILKGNHWLHRERAEEVNQILRQFFVSHGGYR